MAPISRHIVNYLVNPVKGERQGEKTDEEIKKRGASEMGREPLTRFLECPPSPLGFGAAIPLAAELVEKKRFELSTPTLRT